MKVSDRPVSYAPHDWPNSYVCVTVGRSDMSKFTEVGRSFYGIKTMKEHLELESILLCRVIFQRLSIADRSSTGNHDIHREKKLYTVYTGKRE